MLYLKVVSLSSYALLFMPGGQSNRRPELQDLPPCIGTSRHSSSRKPRKQAGSYALPTALGRSHHLGGCGKTLRSPFDELRANGRGLEISDHFPFVLSLSKHEYDFFRSLLGRLTSWQSNWSSGSDRLEYGWRAGSLSLRCHCASRDAARRPH